MIIVSHCPCACIILGSCVIRLGGAEGKGQEEGTEIEILQTNLQLKTGMGTVEKLKGKKLFTLNFWPRKEIQVRSFQVQCCLLSLVVLSLSY